MATGSSPLPAQRLESFLAAREARVAVMRHVANPRHPPEAWGFVRRKTRWRGWATDAALDPCQQRRLRGLFFFTYHVYVSDGGEKSLWLAFLDPHGNQLTLLSVRILLECRGPFRLRIQRRQVIGGQHRDRSLSASTAAFCIPSTKFEPARKSHAWITVEYPASSSSQAIHSAHPVSAPL